MNQAPLIGLALYFLMIYAIFFFVGKGLRAGSR